MKDSFRNKENHWLSFFWAPLIALSLTQLKPQNCRGLYCSRFWPHGNFLIGTSSAKVAELRLRTFGTNQPKGALGTRVSGPAQPLPPEPWPYAAYPEPFMWFLSNCIIWNGATGRLQPALCPHTAHWKKKVNTWQTLTELKWDHWLFSRKGVTTHPSDECLIALAEQRGSANLSASATNQIMTSEESQMQVKGEGLDKLVRLWDGQLGSMVWLRQTRSLCDEKMNQKC